MAMQSIGAALERPPDERVELNLVYPPPLPDHLCPPELQAGLGGGLVVPPEQAFITSLRAWAGAIRNGLVTDPLQVREICYIAECLRPEVEAGSLRSGERFFSQDAQDIATVRAMGSPQSWLLDSRDIGHLGRASILFTVLDGKDVLDERAVSYGQLLEISEYRAMVGQVLAIGDTSKFNLGQLANIVQGRLDLHERIVAALNEESAARVSQMTSSHLAHDSGGAASTTAPGVVQFAPEDGRPSPGAAYADTVAGSDSPRDKIKPVDEPYLEALIPNDALDIPPRRRRDKRTVLRHGSVRKVLAAATLVLSALIPASPHQGDSEAPAKQHKTVAVEAPTQAPRPPILVQLESPLSGPGSPEATYAGALHTDTQSRTIKLPPGGSIWEEVAVKKPRELGYGELTEAQKRQITQQALKYQPGGGMSWQEARGIDSFIVPSPAAFEAWLHQLGAHKDDES
ncbi:MAG TPA: hypothetical protein VIS56_01210 [Candidatus Saccharimonadales bacterium]